MVVNHQECSSGMLFTSLSNHQFDRPHNLGSTEQAHSDTVSCARLSLGGRVWHTRLTQTGETSQGGGERTTGASHHNQIMLTSTNFPPHAMTSRQYSDLRHTYTPLPHTNTRCTVLIIIVVKQWPTTALYGKNLPRWIKHWPPRCTVLIIIVVK